MMPMLFAPQIFRADIQVLRGFAVLIVLFYHSKIGLFSAGYLGVDIFFVISGFLITQLIKNSIDSGNFRFSDFYIRRAKRLLPAAYVTFLVTTLLALVLLTRAEMADFQTQMIGAISFTANIVLWQQSGYFEGAGELKPLLHTWSLAIEEQYYFLLPACLVFMPRRFWLTGAMVVFLISLLICMVQSGTTATFYLFHTRAWELTTGSIGALIVMSKQLRWSLKIIFWPAMLVVIILPFFPIGSYHPGLGALLICLATLVLILRQHPFFFIGPIIFGLRRIGDMSYSLYLVHWPLFAFYNNIWIGETDGIQPTGIRMGIIGLSLLLAYLLNRFVEVPFRRTEIHWLKGLLFLAVASSLILLLITTSLSNSVKSAKDYKQIRRVNYGFGVACEFTTNFEPIPECRNSEEPEILVWGDSFAMHLVPGILGTKARKLPIVQATRSACGPLIGVAGQGGQVYDRNWGENCIRFNDSVIKYLNKTDSIKVVVLSSPFIQFVNRGQRLLKRDELTGTYYMVDAGLAESVAGLKRTSDAIRAMNKRVIIIAPPPSSNFDIGRCIERMDSKLPIIGVAEGCMIDRASYHRERRSVLELMAALPQQVAIEVINFDNYLCDGGLCRTYIDGIFIYRDGMHLSHDGSIFLSEKISLVEKINILAK